MSRFNDGTWFELKRLMLEIVEIDRVDEYAVEVTVPRPEELLLGMVEVGAANKVEVEDSGLEVNNVSLRVVEFGVEEYGELEIELRRLLLGRVEESGLDAVILELPELLAGNSELELVRLLILGDPADDARLEVEAIWLRVVLDEMENIELVLALLLLDLKAEDLGPGLAGIVVARLELAALELATLVLEGAKDDVWLELAETKLPDDVDVRLGDGELGLASVLMEVETGYIWLELAASVLDDIGNPRLELGPLLFNTAELDIVRPELEGTEEDVWPELRRLSVDALLGAALALVTLLLEDPTDNMGLGLALLLLDNTVNDPVDDADVELLDDIAVELAVLDDPALELEVLLLANPVDEVGLGPAPVLLRSPIENVELKLPVLLPDEDAELEI